MVFPHVDAPIPTQALGKDEFSTNPDWIAYVTEMILEAASSGERVLVLTLSYRDTRMLADKLRSLRPCITTLIQHTESAILLSPSCWEGINLPGLVKNLVITRIPFAPPDQTIADLISNAMLKKGHSQKKISATIYGISVVSTRRKLRQAIGRGIRQKSDVSEVWIGDKRILEQKGKLKLESCLPVRFHPALKTADTFTLDRVVMPSSFVHIPEPDPWASPILYF